MQNSSILFNTITDDDNSLGTSGTSPGGLRYIYAVGELNNIPTGIYSIALPFVTISHLVALPKGKNKLNGLDGKVSDLEPVHLEGNYAEYFSLYTAKDKQIDSRYVLDPEAMQFSIEFCAAYAWEIVNNSLYFANDGLLPDLHMIENFVEQITPAQVVKAGLKLNPPPQILEKLSKLHTHLYCPVCNIELRDGKSWVACPSGHGYLIKGTDLLYTRQHMNDSLRSLKEVLGAEPHVVTVVHSVEHGDLKCPNDAQALEKALYQDGPGFLYKCPECSYRWIDGQDLDTILGRYRNDGQDDRS